ncbi:non-hydrolyzing UDP-N-acetylglucosamine 2-epimerase [Acetomicrobium sp.]|uniref:non-hydrolyzing UDP-N-acetylglucosamine 2-epimerase n=1 Tax=Acetomicrobium sp. TaxID=1872099 RepID=UPI002B261F12|nr:UDP-N-acetylglucosamine 2-epimerase (non-hydrolyzing) [Acetomicrobium sp.]
MLNVETITIVGARPQFIKAAAVSRVLRVAEGVKEVLVHTGQHYDANMSDVFFDELEIPRLDYNLGIGSGTHGEQTGRMLEAIEKVLLQEKPDWVQVYGDTNSTLAGALAAVKLHIPVAHIEAGLRSFNRLMPEEINRVLTDHASDLLFAPTKTAMENLWREGIYEDQIKLVGDVMYDAAIFYGKKADQQSHILNKLRLKSKEYILATVHRAENTDDPVRLRAIFDALCEVACEIKVVLPLHPRTREALTKTGIYGTAASRICLTEPVGYLDMVMLEKNACLIATDSGGVQKEAFFYRVPCVTLREETEWVELVELGWNAVVPPFSAHVMADAIRSRIGSFGGVEENPYGDGNSAVKIVDFLVNASR